VGHNVKSIEGTRDIIKWILMTTMPLERNYRGFIGNIEHNKIV
jgi:hypothetical protein